MSSNALLWPSQGTKPEERLDKYKWLRLPSQGIASSQPVIGDLLLDLFPGAAVGYSLRQLRTAYFGAAIRVQRTSDNAEQDIGFLTNGDLDVDSLLTFVGASDGIVTIIYDQSTNGIDLDDQLTTSELPKIVIAGTLQTLNSLPSIFFDGIDDITISSLSLQSPTSEIFIFCVWSKPTMGNRGTQFNLNSPDSVLRVSVHAPFDDGFIVSDMGNFTSDRLQTDDSIYNDVEQHTYTFTKTAGVDKQIIKRDGIQIAEKTQASSTTVLDKVALGNFNDTAGTFAEMQFQELVFYDINKSSSLIEIEQNTIDYWLLSLLKVVFPPIGDLDYINYKFYQVNKKEIDGEESNFIWEITDSVGTGIFLEPSGFDIRVFTSTGTPLIYEVTSIDVITGNFTIKITNPTLKDLDVIQIVFGKSDATDGSTSLGTGNTLSTHIMPLLTKDEENVLVDDQGNEIKVRP